QPLHQAKELLPRRLEALLASESTITAKTVVDEYRPDVVVLCSRKPATKSVNNGRGMGGSSAGVLRFYTDDAPGLKVGPTTVLVGALLFVGFVVLLHVWGKFRG
ncbi:hypothetical protein AaE_002581, partial [Aphanomyces astaci]